MRLHHFIASNSDFSRREAEKLINEGKVLVNGRRITKQGLKIDHKNPPTIEINGKSINKNTKKITLILNKPAGYITTRKDTHGRKTVMDLVPYKDLYPVGRLDKDTEGLLILTNDGDLAYELTHPKFEHKKEYLVKFKGELDKNKKRKLENGVVIEGKKTSPCKITKVKDNSCNITIHEGRKRQIRNMFRLIECPVIYLMRLRIGRIKLGKLPKGKYKLIKL